jgi:hypothetical protein
VFVCRCVCVGRGGHESKPAYPLHTRKQTHTNTHTQIHTDTDTHTSPQTDSPLPHHPRAVRGAGCLGHRDEEGVQGFEGGPSQRHEIPCLGFMLVFFFVCVGVCGVGDGWIETSMHTYMRVDTCSIDT